MSVNRDKTKILHFRPASVRRSDYTFVCGDIPLDYEKRYRYLGLWLDEHLDFKHTVRELSKSATRALGALYGKYISAGGMTNNVFAILFATLIEPIMYYGAGIWGTREHKLLNTVQNKAAILFLGTGKNALNLATQADMGWSSPTFKQKTEVFRLYMKIHEMNDNRISRKIHVWSYNFHLGNRLF